MNRTGNIELIAEYFGYEGNDLDTWKKDAERLTDKEVAGISNLVKRRKESCYCTSSYTCFVCFKYRNRKGKHD